MTQTAIKICGLQSVEVIKSLLPLQVEMIGFVFAKSRRQVSPAEAGFMLEAVREWGSLNKGFRLPKSVGVFVNPTLEELGQVLDTARLDVVQLHGQETPEFCRQVKEHFSVEVIKVISLSLVDSDQTYEDVNSPESISKADFKHEQVGAIPDAQQRLLESYSQSVDAVLLDTYDPLYGGGSGKMFDWSLIRPYQDWAQAKGVPLLIAGGLNESNVGQLVEKHQPDGVDVSSGVERGGVKDISLITAFVERVRGE